MLTNFPLDPYLDLPDYRGQRVESFTFEHRDGVTDAFIGMLHPDRDKPLNLSHDTSSSIKRTLMLTLPVRETALVNPIRDRILPFMHVGGKTYPLGRYMFSNETDLTATEGEYGTYTLFDEGFIIEQEITEGFTSTASVDHTVLTLLSALPLKTPHIETAPYPAVGAYAVGTNRGQIMATLADQGGMFPYWLNNEGRVRMIVAFDPAAVVADFDFDAGNKVRRRTINFVSDVLVAPNRFVVIGNGSKSSDTAVVGVYDIPPNAPHSIANRGFVIQQTTTLQLDSSTQAIAVAQAIGLQQTVYERITVTTALDPRHDSYNVIHFRGANWLELAWTMALVPGGDMQHTIRKAY